MFVNCDKEDVDVKITLSGINDPVLYSPLENAFVSARFSNKNGITEASFKIKAKDTLIIMEN